MRHNGVWGTYVEVHALEQLAKIPIAVFSDLNNLAHVDFEDFHFVDYTADTIFILNKGNWHYTALRPPAEFGFLHYVDPGDPGTNRLFPLPKDVPPVYEHDQELERLHPRTLRQVAKLNVHLFILICVNSFFFWFLRQPKLASKLALTVLSWTLHLIRMILLLLRPLHYRLLRMVPLCLVCHCLLGMGPLCLVCHCLLGMGPLCLFCYCILGMGPLCLI
jgi:hypothetical protein